MCRTFSLPEIKRADLFAAAAKATNVLDAAAASDAQFQQQGGCYDAGSWTDEDLMDLLNNFPDELEMDIDFSSGSSDDVGSSNSFDDSSVDHQSLSSEDTAAASLTSNSSLATNTAYNRQHMMMPMVNLPTFDFGSVHYGLYAPEEGFVSLPSPKSFAHLSMKSPALLREEKLNVLDPFIGALNEGDLFSLFSICQSLCAPTVAFNSSSCGFNYFGPLSVMSFWTLLFEEHYQGRIQCLSRRLNSTLRNNNSMRNSQHQYQFIGESSLYESVDFVLKLEGCRLSEFRSFELFQALMNSGCVHDNLSLPEMINIAEAFYKEYQTTMSPSHQIYNMVYLFEINLKFHALHHTIAQWNFELIAVQCNN